MLGWGPLPPSAIPHLDCFAVTEGENLELWKLRDQAGEVEMDAVIPGELTNLSSHSLFPKSSLPVVVEDLSLIHI